VSNRLFASHDTPFQNIKIIKLFWCLIDRLCRTILLLKNIKNYKNILVSNRPFASHNTLFSKNTRYKKYFWCQPGRTRRMTFNFQKCQNKILKIKYSNQVLSRTMWSLILHYEWRYVGAGQVLVRFTPQKSKSFPNHFQIVL